jgi:hypothetical protein
VVEQKIDLRFRDGRLTLLHNVGDTTTTENGQPLP